MTSMRLCSALDCKAASEKLQFISGLYKQWPYAIDLLACSNVVPAHKCYLPKGSETGRWVIIDSGHEH